VPDVDVQKSNPLRATNQPPTKGLTEGGDLREAQVDVPQSI